MPYKTMIDNLKNNQSLSLSNIEEGDVKSLAQALKGTQITRLDLSNSNIGCNGLKLFNSSFERHSNYQT